MDLVDENNGFHKDYLQKKEAKGKWDVFWVILNGKHLLFYESKKSQQLVGSIQIGVNTKCVLAKRKTYSFPFTLCAANGRHLFKCETSIRRHQWITAIHEASQLIKSSLSHDLIPSEQNVNDVHEATAGNPSLSDDESPDEILPSSVLRVIALPDPLDSPSLPFRIRDRKDPPQVDIDQPVVDLSPKPTISIFPYTPQNDESPHAISDSERKQISALNLNSHSLPLDSLCATDCSGSSQYRSFPSTPEKGNSSCLVSPQTLCTSSDTRSRSKSLNSLTSSDSFSPSNTRFSRHMVSGNVMDMEH